jgi:hypothetical protein
MFFFGLRGLVLLAIAAMLVLRIGLRYAGRNRSNTFSAPRWSPTSRNSFCTSCGAPLQGTGQFCGNCGARRE